MRNRLGELAQRAKSWFSHREEQWLFVSDGADCVYGPNSLDYVDLSSFLPETFTVDIIIISCSKMVENLANLGSISICEMDYD